MRGSLERGLAQVGSARRRDDLLAPTLTEFLLERIAEDEAQARSALVLYGSGMHPLDPARVLAECEARAAIVRDACALEDEYAGIGLWAAVRALASVYADHPDFREEWLT